MMGMSPAPPTTSALSDLAHDHLLNSALFGESGSSQWQAMEYNNMNHTTIASIKVSIKEANTPVADFQFSFSIGSVGVGCCIASIANALVIEVSQRLVYTMSPRQ